jgi:hypothetical protein
MYTLALNRPEWCVVTSCPASEPVSTSPAQPTFQARFPTPPPPRHQTRPTQHHSHLSTLKPTSSPPRVQNVVSRPSPHQPQQEPLLRMTIRSPDGAFTRYLLPSGLPQPFCLILLAFCCFYPRHHVALRPCFPLLSLFPIVTPPL